MSRRVCVAVAGAFLALSASAVAGSSSSGRIVFVTNHLCGGRQVDCGRAEIATVRADGSGAVVLTRNAVSEASPAWSPNGAQIAFFRPTRRGSSGQVWLMNANGTGQRQLTHLKKVQFYGDLDWAPDGLSLVIKAFPSGIGGATELWLVNARTGAVSQLTKTVLGEGAPSWSPNGRWIAFSSEGRLRSGRIWRMTVGTKKLVQLTAGSTSLYPSWSPDSSRIAFTLGGKLALMNADGSHRRVLPQFGTHPRFSPDGQWLVYVANGDLFEVRTNGTGRTQLTHHGKQTVNDQPDW
jgi:Tol biopolymer transport system component